MSGEEILGAIVMFFCGFGCGGLFYWIGTWASQRKDPMHFWTGSTVDPKTISDIPAYNQANAQMWKRDVSCIHDLKSFLGKLIIH